jgi:hypothetical protein
MSGRAQKCGADPVLERERRMREKAHLRTPTRAYDDDDGRVDPVHGRAAVQTDDGPTGLRREFEESLHGFMIAQGFPRGSPFRRRARSRILRSMNAPGAFSSWTTIR